MTDKLDDLALLEGARRYEEDALAEIYRRYSPALYRYAVRLLGEPALAEDCIAETFSRFLHSLRRGGGPGRFLKAYLYRTAHNWIVDHIRRSASVPVLPDLADSGEGQPSEIVRARMERERIRTALLELTPVQRQVIVLKYLEGFTNEEVAAALRKSVGAVKSMQHRALATLKRLMDEKEAPE
jgi:RNA polymerase sigma-70 factor (ECF subfamily)